MAKNRSRVIRALLPLIVVLGLGSSPGVGEDLSRTPLPNEFIARETAAAPAVVCFLEGPAVDAAGNVFFSDIAGNRILKMDPKGSGHHLPCRQRPHQRQLLRCRGPAHQL